MYVMIGNYDHAQNELRFKVLVIEKIFNWHKEGEKRKTTDIHTKKTIINANNSEQK